MRSSPAFGAGERGSGLKYGVECSEDDLSKNWQRLILTHLKEKTHKGVLTGSAITDMEITLVSGKAHNKHTEGDFREATYRTRTPRPKGSRIRIVGALLCFLVGSTGENGRKGND